MSGYIIVDCESTGLFTYKNPDGTTRPSDAPGQPRMCQYAAVLMSDAFEIERTFSAYVRPRNWFNADGTPMESMPEKAFEIHGLTMEFLLEKGLHIEQVLVGYRDSIMWGRTVVGHNQQHDGRQIRAELRHAGMADLFEQTKTTCTMRSAQAAGMKIKKLNGKGGYPRLIDLAAHFGISYDPELRHTAPEDAMVTALCAAELGKRGLLLPGQVHYANDKPQPQEG